MATFSHKGRRKKRGALRFLTSRTTPHGHQGQGLQRRVARRGRQRIHLTDDADEIEGRTDKVKGLVLRTEFLKKA